jgi:death-on-curing protein
MTPFNRILNDIIQERFDVLLKLSEKEVIIPEAEKVLEINKTIISTFGGIHGVRSKDLLCSSLESIVNHFIHGERELRVLASILLEKIIKNHPFIDGNKRTAVVVMEMFLRLNNVDYKINNADILRTVYDVAQNKIDSKRIFMSLFLSNDAGISDMLTPSITPRLNPGDC